MYWGYMNGEGVPQDAALQKNGGAAQQNLGVMYQWGNGEVLRLRLVERGGASAADR
ncbi:hypothetical protein ACLK2I_23335 [Escherichia coli]